MGGVRLDWRVDAWSVSVRRGARGGAQEERRKSAGRAQKSWQGEREGGEEEAQMFELVAVRRAGARH